MRALLDDPDTAAMAFCVDLTTELAHETGYTRVAREAFAKTDKPFAVLSNMASAIDQRDARFVREAGIPVLEGTTTGLMAFKHLFELRDYRARPPVPAAGRRSGVAEPWRRRLQRADDLSPVESFALLDAYGIGTIKTEEASSVDEAAAAAGRIGWPVALKTAAADTRHKTEAGGVRLGIRDAEALRAAYLDLSGRLGPNVVVQAMSSAGVEVALGVVHDEQFGPMVMAAAGGTLVEVLRDRRFALPPLDLPRARSLIDRLAVRPLLDGVRGGPPAHVDAVAEALVRLSVLAQELGDLVEAIDVNPLVAGPQGCVAVDVLVVRRGG
jgi:acetate---CoA ligase (ADP-forming)